MTTPTPAPRASTSHRGLLFAFLAVVALLLTACGPKVDTILTINRDGSGTRVLSLTFENDSPDWDEIEGDIAAIDESIQRHLPEELEYSGFTDDGDNVTGTFTLSFASPEEYLEKAQSVLSQGGEEWDEYTTVTIEDSRFRSGLELDEWFDDGDLLAWMFNGLIADGILSEDAEGQTLYEGGETSVEWDGETFESYQPFTLREISDNGFTTLSMQTRAVDDGLERVITYGLEDVQDYTSNQELYDDFFAELEDAGMTLSEGTEETGKSWELTIMAEDEADLIEQTNAALLSEDTVFTVTRGTDEYNPLASTWEVSEYAECSAICSSDVWDFSDTVIAPGAGWEGGWDVTEDGVSTETLSFYEGEESTTSFSRSAELSAVDVEVTLSENNTEFVSRMSLPASDAAGLSDAMKELLGGDGVDVTEETDGDTTTFVVKISGGDDFNETYAAWSQGYASGVSVESHPDSGMFSKILGFDVSMVAVPDVLESSGAVYDTPITWTIHGPSGLSIDEESVSWWTSAGQLDGTTLTAEGGSYFDASFVAKGTPASFWIFWGVLLGVLIAVGVTLFLMRKKIAAAIAARREKQATALAQSQAHAESQGSSTGPGATPSTWVGQPAHGASAGMPENEADYL